MLQNLTPAMDTATSRLPKAPVLKKALMVALACTAIGCQSGQLRDSRAEPVEPNYSYVTDTEDPSHPSNGEVSPQRDDLGPNLGEPSSDRRVSPQDLLVIPGSDSIDM